MNKEYFDKELWNGETIEKIGLNEASITTAHNLSILFLKKQFVRDTPLTRDPDVTIEARLKVDPAFAVALYREQRKQIAELEEQNLNMLALFRDFYELEFNRDECGEIIKKYGGDA